MTRDEFKSHVEEAIEDAIRYAEKQIGRPLPRSYCFQWLGAEAAPVQQHEVVEFITHHTYIDSEHIYPCFDIGVDDMLEDGRLLLVGYRAGYPPQAWGTNWTGREGPFVLIMGQKLLDRLQRT